MRWQRSAAGAEAARRRAWARAVRELLAASEMRALVQPPDALCGTALEDKLTLGVPVSPVRAR